MECQNCGATSTTKKYPGKVGTLCVPCWARRVTIFQDEADEEFERVWRERVARWGRITAVVVLDIICLAALMWWWLWS